MLSQPNWISWNWAHIPSCLWKRCGFLFSASLKWGFQLARFPLAKSSNSFNPDFRLNRCLRAKLFWKIQKKLSIENYVPIRCSKTFLASVTFWKRKLKFKWYTSGAVVGLLIGVLTRGETPKSVNLWWMFSEQNNLNAFGRKTFRRWCDWVKNVRHRRRVDRMTNDSSGRVAFVDVHSLVDRIEPVRCQRIKMKANNLKLNWKRFLIVLQLASTIKISKF